LQEIHCRDGKENTFPATSSKKCKKKIDLVAVFGYNTSE
jgi:hypothetical protein